MQIYLILKIIIGVDGQFNLSLFIYLRVFNILTSRADSSLDKYYSHLPNYNYRDMLIDLTSFK